MNLEKPLTRQQRDQCIGLAIADHERGRRDREKQGDFDGAYAYVEAVNKLREILGR